jgi:hypothetical protein
VRYLFRGFTRSSGLNEVDPSVPALRSQALYLPSIFRADVSSIPGWIIVSTVMAF